MKTDLDDLHEYQERIDNQIYFFNFNINSVN